jgi:hypothetical protein
VKCIQTDNDCKGENPGAHDGLNVQVLPDKRKCSALELRPSHNIFTVSEIQKHKWRQNLKSPIVKNSNFPTEAPARRCHQNHEER